MQLNKTISIVAHDDLTYLLEIKEVGYDYFDSTIPVVNINLNTEGEISRYNSFRTLSVIANTINDYFQERNVILYYYCSHAPVNKRIESQSPQAYRNALFSALSSRIVDKNSIFRVVRLLDNESNEHYMAFIAKAIHASELSKIITDITSANSK